MVFAGCGVSGGVVVGLGLAVGEQPRTDVDWASRDPSGSRSGVPAATASGGNPMVGEGGGLSPLFLGVASGGVGGRREITSAPDSSCHVRGGGVGG